MVALTALSPRPDMPSPQSPSPYAWVWSVPGVDARLCPKDEIKRQIVEELMAAVLTRHNSERIQLRDCSCLTAKGRPRDGFPFPCEHVMEAADDPALRYILESEELTRGLAGQHTIDRTARRLVMEEPGNPGCWGWEGVKDGYHPSRQPLKPTKAEPNTKEKDEVFWERFTRGQSLFHPDDPRYEVPLPEEGEGVEYDD